MNQEFVHVSFFETHVLTSELVTSLCGCRNVGGGCSTSPSEVSGELLIALENLNEQLFVPARTHSRIKSPRLVASGL